MKLNVWRFSDGLSGHDAQSNGLCLAIKEIVSIEQFDLDIDSIKNFVKSYSDPMEGTVNIGLIPTIAPYLLPLILENINKTYPQLEIILHELKTEVMLNKLAGGSLDAGILATPIEPSGFE